MAIDTLDPAMAAAEIPQRKAGASQAVVLLAATTLPIMGVISLVPVIPLLLQRFSTVPGATYLVPLALVAPGLCIALLSPFMGMVADRIGRRSLLLTALAFYAAFGMVPLFLDHLGAIIISRFGLGVTEAVIMTVTTTLTGDYFSAEDRQKWIGAQTAIGSLTATALFLTGGMLGSLGWQGPFYLYALAIPVLFAAIAFLWEPEASHHQLKRKGRPTSTFPWRAMVGICLTAAFCSVAFYAAPLQLGVRLGEVGVVGAAAIGVTAGVASLGVPVGALLFRRTKSDVATLLAGVLLLIGVGLFGIGLGGSVGTIGAAMFINQLGCGMMMPCLITWCLSKLSFEHRGQGSGLWTSAFFMGQFFSPLIMTGLADQGRGMATAFLIAGSITASSAVFVGAARWRREA